MEANSGMLAKATPEAALPRAEILRQSFQLAVKSHDLGQFEDAEKLYRAILAVDPLHADALHGLGVMAHQVGRHDLAAELIGQALAQRTEPTFHNNLGLVLLALGRPNEAMASIFRALELRSSYPQAFNALGNVQLKLGALDEAIASYQRAIDLRPDYVDAHANLGKALQEKGKPEKAEEANREALRLNPACVEAHNNLGNLLRAKGNFDEAVESLDRALALRPTFAEAHNNRGVALAMLGKLDEAVAAFRCALAIRPDFALAHTGLGSALMAKGDFDASLACFEKAVAIEPKCLEAHNNMGSVLLHLNRTDEAVRALETAIDLIGAQYRADAHYNLGTTLLVGDKVDEAIRSFGKAIEIDQAHSAALNNLGCALQFRGEATKAAETYGRAFAVRPDYADAYSNRLMAMHYMENVTNEEVLAAALTFGETFDRPDPRRFAERDLSPDRRLRIGYVSGDFNQHACSFFFTRSLAAHDRRNFEIFCYYNWSIDDNVTDHIRGLSDHWRVIAGKSDPEVAETIRQDAIDVLVDLSGHTGKTRTPMFGLKPAPIQACWLGYFGTTGLATMDYLILDPVSAPQGAERWYREALVRLPYGRFCYATPPFALTPDDPPSLARGQVTFGCFNNVAKISQGAMKLWAEILRRTPESRLILKWKSLSEESVRARLFDAFAAQGVAPERVELRGATPYFQMLNEYNDIDIALDPFPFCGATTSCEALWMGVPVITLPGDRLASRQTLGFLTYMGHGELAAQSPEDYVESAVALARDPARLLDYRQSLRQAMDSAPFCDGPKFTATLEAAFRQMWRRHVAGERPAPLDIPPAD
jgi:predicted O-linked N-acetylglucosamine transferase (SPINDLY family)